jgi:hypothetical protein
MWYQHNYVNISSKYVEKDYVNPLKKCFNTYATIAYPNQ